MNAKKVIGEKAADFVRDGMVVGLGTGSTVFYTINKLGNLTRQGLRIKGISTSIQTENLAKNWGIPLVRFEEIEEVDIAIDGADEVSSDLDLIKGGGGALLREKIIAKAAKTFVVVADPSKIVEKLGEFHLPVEVVPFGAEMTKRQIYELGGYPHLREFKGKPYRTDNGNYIFDCIFPTILKPEILEKKLNMIPGVVENGLFIGMTDILITLNNEKNIVIKE